MRSFCECVAGFGAAHAGQAGKQHIRPRAQADSPQTAIAPVGGAAPARSGES